MGEVYSARDPRLGRTVAIKVLPAIDSADASRRHRFEHEARTTGLLNHPNILVVFDVGDHEGAPYLVTELLDGETLRERLRAGAIPVRKAMDYALQMAHGLAAAHDKAIVHRDLKPENLFVTRDGVLKILDFGLARQEVVPGVRDTRSPTVTRETGPGVVLGTVGYMSPEQARGETADHRSDIFALGAVLYEMLTGRRAFHGDTAVETLNAILKEEPEELAPELKVPLGLDRVVRHCLEKKREDRFQAARDVAFALETLGSGSQAAAAAAAPPRRRWLRALAAAAGAVAFTALGVLAGRPLWERQQPTFKPLTFRRGFADNARFAPDGRTVIYGAAWDGQPTELFMTRTDSPESRPLGLRFARVLSVSADGRMAVLLDPARRGGFFGWGTLAEVPLTGGVPREILENVGGAEWTSDGRELCVARQTREGVRIELPPGQALYVSSGGRFRFLRLSPAGSHVAFEEDGKIVVVDRATKERRVLVEKPPSNLYGLAWAPGGREVWYTAGPTVGARDVLAVDLHGRRRVIYRSAGTVSLLDTRPGRSCAPPPRLRLDGGGRALSRRRDRPRAACLRRLAGGGGLGRRPDGAPEQHEAWLGRSCRRKGQLHTETGRAGRDPNCRPLGRGPVARWQLGPPAARRRPVRRAGRSWRPASHRPRWDRSPWRPLRSPGRQPDRGLRQTRGIGRVALARAANGRARASARP
jgi:hypothetical protein